MTITTTHVARAAEECRNRAAVRARSARLRADLRAVLGRSQAALDTSRERRRR